MRPLRPMPAGIGLPLAELILGNRGFRSIAMERPGALPTGPRKPLKRLDLNFYIMTDPTECETLPRRSARRSNRQVVCAHNLSMSERGRSVGLPPFGAWYHFGIKAAEAFRREQVRGDTPPCQMWWEWYIIQIWEF